MNISKELLEKAKQAKSAEDLLEMAKAENIELTEEQAAKAFAQLNKNGELSDEELDNVSGGGCGQPAINHRYQVGQTVKIECGLFGRTIYKYYKITRLAILKYHNGKRNPAYECYNINSPADVTTISESQIVGLA